MLLSRLCEGVCNNHNTACCGMYYFEHPSLGLESCFILIFTDSIRAAEHCGHYYKSSCSSTFKQNFTVAITHCLVLLIRPSEAVVSSFHVFFRSLEYDKFQATNVTSSNMRDELGTREVCCRKFRPTMPNSMLRLQIKEYSKQELGNHGQLNLQ